MKITFIGAGNMAEAIIAGIIKNKKISEEEITISDISQERLDYMKQTLGVKLAANNTDAVKDAEVVVLAIKPQVFDNVWESLQASIPSSALIISIMAGISSNKIESGSKRRVVRVMPNTPSLIGEGASGVAPGKYALDEDMKIALDLMSACGLALEFSEEQLHAVTALSGSGPAYIFYFIEAMRDAGIELGLSDEQANLLATATVSGAGKMAQISNVSSEELRNRVTSKGGTTAAAINLLDEQKIKDTIYAAMNAAYNRSKELGES